MDRDRNIESHLPLQEPTSMMGIRNSTINRINEADLSMQIGIKIIGVKHVRCIIT